MVKLGILNGLVGWWKFDEGSGTVAYDSSGNGHDGNLNLMDQLGPRVKLEGR